MDKSSIITKDSCGESQSKSESQQIKVNKKLSQMVKQQENENKRQVDKVHQLLRKQNYKKLVKELKNDAEKYQLFESLQYRGEKFEQEQDVCVKSNEKFEYVGKILKIINILDDQKHCIPLIKIQWQIQHYYYQLRYFRKADIQNYIKQNELQWVSDNELFLTEEKDVVLVESIICKAKILTIQEYDGLAQLESNIFYTRSKFNCQSKQFNPPIEYWDKICVCKSPLNPDLEYIQCENCERWYHTKCVITQAEELEKIEYLCSQCNIKQ